MTRRRLDLIIALLLPLMVLRALLPAGYMPVAEDGELRIVMCSDGLVPAAASSADDGSTQHKLPPNAGDCPFAHAAIDAPAVVVVITAVAAPVLPGLIAGRQSNLPLATGPPRHHSARGPPALS